MQGVGGDLGVQDCIPIWVLYSLPTSHISSLLDRLVFIKFKMHFWPSLFYSLQSQLRNRLITELKQIGVNQQFSHEPIHPDDGSLLHRAANSLVADHLRRCHYDYSLSVFLPECGIPEDKVGNTPTSALLFTGVPGQTVQYHKTWSPCYCLIQRCTYPDVSIRSSSPIEVPSTCNGHYQLSKCINRIDFGPVWAEISYCPPSPKNNIISENGL